MATQNIALCGTTDWLNKPNNGNILKFVEMLGIFDGIMKKHVRREQPKDTRVNYLGKRIQNEIIDMLAEEFQQTVCNYHSDAAFAGALASANVLAEEMCIVPCFRVQPIGRPRKKRSLFGYEGEDEPVTDPQQKFETPSEETFGYKEFVEAAKTVKHIPVALCSDKEAWAKLSIMSDTIAIFRKADNHQDNLQLSETKKVEADGLARFITMNELRYITEYNQVTAVGLFQSEVKAHLLLFINRGSGDYKELKDRLGALAPEFVGEFLFVLVHGVKSNEKSLGYFGLTSRDLPRVGIYDRDSDMKWLMPEGEISTERVREFCQSLILGNLKEVKQAGEPDPKTEL
ncbi:endoplasmic reticulum resident protein 27-like [Salvelinus namaycush]|uniref:Endoplasmic reticulum resident protein 27-like n=1 Tax=Salvelinus namaycush TaxID=8040 RepID=A0A8U0TZ60_SALNM|nr:endoplasmic reticulum resident protein 27-like [Salvelinus namaycush]